MDEEERTACAFWTDQIQVWQVEFKVCEKRQIKHIVNYNIKQTILSNEQIKNNLSLAHVYPGDEHGERVKHQGGELSVQE